MRWGPWGSPVATVHPVRRLSGFASDFEAASEFLTHAATESFIQGFFADSIGPNRRAIASQRLQRRSYSPIARHSPVVRAGDGRTAV